MKAHQYSIAWVETICKPWKRRDVIVSILQSERRPLSSYIRVLTLQESSLAPSPGLSVIMMQTDDAMNGVPVCQNPDRYFAESMIPHHQVCICIAYGITTVSVSACHNLDILHCKLLIAYHCWHQQTLLILPLYAGRSPYGAVGAQLWVKCSAAEYITVNYKVTNRRD